MKHSWYGGISFFRTTGSITLCIYLTLITMAIPCQGYGFTIGEERKVGEKLLYMVRKEFDLLDSPDITQYLNRLGSEILEVAKPRYYDYHFFLIKDKEFNAFAAPSGLIFLFSGLVETMHDEDELVSVMSHEVAHVISRHLASRFEKNRKIAAGTMALALASLAVGNPALSQGLLAGTLAAGQTLSLRFSRLDEEEADRLSFSWMRAMHRDPRAMERMLRTMRRITRYRRGGEVPPYLLTHPEPETRLFYVQSLLDLDDKQKETGYYRQRDAFDFLRMKYRMLVEIKEAAELRNSFATILSSSETSELGKSMARYGQALLLARELQPERAIHLLEQVRKEVPNHPILLTDTAILYLESGDPDKALGLLKRAHERDPDDLYTTFQLGRVMAKKGKLKEAEQLYLTVAEAMPEYSTVYYEIGRIRTAQGRAAEGTFSLALYNLYEGNIKQAKQFVNRTLSTKDAPKDVITKAKELATKIQQLEKEEK